MTTTITIPTVETDRLTLRASQPRDLDALAAFYASDRSRYVGGPRSRADCQRTLAVYIGQWHFKGFGFWQIENRETGETLGAAGFIDMPGWDEPELGWHLYNGHEGQGYATEAAIAARTYGAAHFGLNGVISYIAHENTRSIQLAEKLGARFERDGELNGQTCLVYRHPKEPVQ